MLERAKRYTGYTAYDYEDMSVLREHIRQGGEPTGYEGLAGSGMTAVLDNGMAGTSTTPAKSTRRWSRAIVDLIPKARLVVFENSGHSPQIEEADLWRKVVRDFLSEVGADGFAARTGGPADHD